MKIKCDANCERLDLFCSLNSDLSRSYCQRLIKEGKILVNGKNAVCKQSVKVGDEIEFLQTEPEKLNLQPVDIPLDVIYQDDYLAVINKQQGLTVHAGNCYDTEPTLVNALLYKLDKLSTINGVVRPGIVHRIDKNTSGLLVVAKCDEAHRSLAKQIEEKTCKRTYLALLEGVLKEDSGNITTYINRCDKDKTKMAVTEDGDGKLASTDFKVIKRYSQYTLCEFSLKTGRTHQIRVHAKYMGHPVVGDKEYGYKKQKFNLNGQLLHAYKLEFTHPITKERLTFTAPLPDYFEKTLKILENLK